VHSLLHQSKNCVVNRVKIKTPAFPARAGGVVSRAQCACALSCSEIMASLEHKRKRVTSNASFTSLQEMCEL